MVDPESVVGRLGRLDALITDLERTRERGIDAYLADDETRLATERRLQLAEQICIDVGAHLVTEVSAPQPADYAGIFVSLADSGQLEHELAGRLMDMARQRNLLVHSYLEIDDHKIFESLGHLDDMRAFAATVERLLEAEE